MADLGLSEDDHLTMMLLARGKAAKEIAQFLGEPASRVERRVDRIRHKLGAATTTQAMSIWQRSRAAFFAMSVDE